MRRTLNAEETRLWRRVAETLRPAPGRTLPEAPEPEPPPPSAPAPAPAGTAPPPRRNPHQPRPLAPLLAIEPGRARRLERERDAVEARLDLHGMGFDQARSTLHAFVLRSVSEGRRAVLVITGKGLAGDGLLRRWTPEWLAEPALRPYVAGVSLAHRRHGGEGALYVALKRAAP